jgi:decaprenylphospho-beta-D-erythro-pentofuranosid-2-ulose 2-reductase
MRNAVGDVESVLVLGGTSEIAVATVEALVRRGCARVVLAGRDVHGMASAATAIEQAGATVVERIAFDARRTETHDATLDAAFAGGDVDLVLLAFGVLGDQAAFEADPDAAVEAVETNYVGAVSAMLRLLPRLEAQGHGTIVVLSSVAGERVRAANVVYGSSKAGLDGLALGLGDARWGSGTRVLVVRPGFVRTRMTAGLPAAPLATTPERVAADIVKGLEGSAEVVWSPGALRWVMAVLRHLPRGLFRLLPV